MSTSEEDRREVYFQARQEGLSDAEAREEAWPGDGGEPHIHRQPKHDHEHLSKDQGVRLPDDLCEWGDHVWGPEGRGGYCTTCFVSRSVVILIGQPSWDEPDVVKLADAIHGFSSGSTCNRCLELAAHAVRVAQKVPRDVVEIALEIMAEEAEAAAEEASEEEQG